MSVETVTALGLMSGTSADGIDVAIIKTDGERVLSFGPSETFPYPPDLVDRLKALYGQEPDLSDPKTIEISDDLTDAHADAVITLLATAGLMGPAIDLIGFHGQTVWHDPGAGKTVQLGNPQSLANETGRPVVFGFRTADVAAGGQGAPLAPLYHAALARDLEKPIAVLNLGGVGNVTMIGDDGAVISAFDTGPANALIDDWVTGHGMGRFDADGALAAVGHIDNGVLASLLDHPYFDLSPPKSLDRQAFSFDLGHELSPADGAATLVAFTAGSVARSIQHMLMPPTRWLVTGGGRHNPVLMAALQATLNVPVEPVEAVGWNGDALEAQAFAYLAVRSLRKLPLSLPQTTGVPQPLSGGTLFEPVEALFA